MCLSSFCIEWVYIFALICDFSFISRFFLNILSVGSDCNEMREQCILICCSYFAQKRDAYWPFTSFCTKIVLTSKLITAVKLWADHCYFEFVLFVLFTPKKYCSLNWGDQQLVLRDSLHLYNQLCDHTNTELLAESFNTFFSEKNSKIVIEVESERSIESKDVDHLNEFRTLSQAELEKFLDKFSLKSGLMVLFPVKYLKSIPYCWIEAMLLIVNSSKEEGVFPSQLEKAAFRPPLKQEIIDHNDSSVSDLSVTSIFLRGSWNDHCLL